MKKYSIWQRMLIALFASWPTKYRKEKDGYVMYYAFKCSIHGYVENYPHGNGGRLICPKCIENTHEQ